MNKFLSVVIFGAVFAFSSHANIAPTVYIDTNRTESYPQSIDILEFNTPELNQDWVFCLAKNIYYESRGEPVRGQIAVAAVTLNRLNDPRFPDDLCEVIYQRVNRRCQFSWVCMRNNPPTGESWERSIELATQYLLGYHTDPTNGAIFFSNPRYTSFGRNVRRAIAIGNHRFW
jgi:spore germination cell wall hydrolase CwlJ-like protein